MQATENRHRRDAASGARAYGLQPRPRAAMVIFDKSIRSLVNATWVEKQANETPWSSTPVGSNWIRRIQDIRFAFGPIDPGLFGINQTGGFKPLR